MSAVIETHRQHGTYVKYVVEQCRCPECGAANRNYERARKRRVEPAYVGAYRARQHLRELADQGVGLKSVERLSGVAGGALSKIVYGDYGRGTAPSKRIRRSTEQAILAVTAESAPGGTRVPAGPVWADVRALLDRGWTKAGIGRRVHGEHAVALQLGADFVTRGNARMIHALLDEPVPPRRSRHGLHPVPQPEPDPADWDREQARLRKQRERHPDEPVGDPYNLPTLTLDEPQAWRQQAPCGRPEVPNYLFFPARGDTETLERARAVCARCPVHTECLDFALATHQMFGVWAGTSEKQRRQMRRPALSSSGGTP